MTPEFKIDGWKLVQPFKDGVVCLRHLECEGKKDGECACGVTGCSRCGEMPPEELVGFKELMIWSFGGDMS